MSEFVAYEDLCVGRELAKVTQTVRHAEVERYRLACGCAVASSAEVLFDGRVPVPPTYAAIFARAALEQLPAPPGGVHAKQQYTFREPLFVGDVVTTGVRIIDKYEKRGRHYVVMKTSSCNQTGIVVITGLATRIWSR